MKRAALCAALLLCMVATGDDAPDSGIGGPNGRFWKKLWSEDVKVGYLYGYMHGIAWAGASEDAKDMFGPSSFEETVHGVDQFYRKAENASLPISVALTAFGKKVHGATDAEIDEYVSPMRHLMNRPLTKKP